VNVLVVGSGAREHALALGISRSASLGELHAAPGNPGIASLGLCHPVAADDVEGLLTLATSLAIELVVIGPEAPLVAGVGDELRRAGVSVFGPSAAAARIEGSKVFAKEVMAAAGVASAATLGSPSLPCVVKADGLASGKGVFVCRTQDQLEAGLRVARTFGSGVVIEELLEGPEVSLFALSDGRRAVVIGAAQDFKRARDGDEGPNTGGMGAYAPLEWLGDPTGLVEQVHQPVIDELARRGTPFVGCLFAGLMLTEAGPRVLEFNARFGDPETQALVPRLEGDLLEALAAAASGAAGGGLREGSDAAVTVVLTAPDYPARSDYAGAVIEGLDAAERAGGLVFHGGTAVHDGRLVTNGGRILSVTGLAPSREAARARAYAAVGELSFAGMQFRTDIAKEAHA
jgi:phosphoribosylamine---glycine ligase